MDMVYTVSSMLVGISWAASLVLMLKYVFGVKLSALAASLYIISMTALFTVMFMLLDDTHVQQRTTIIMAYAFFLICLRLRKPQRCVMVFSVYVIIISAAESLDIILLYTVFDYTPITCFIINTISIQLFTFIAYIIKNKIINIVNRDRPEKETLLLTGLAAVFIFLAAYIQLEFEYSLLKGEDMNPKTYPLFLAITAVTYLAAAIAATGFIKSAGVERKNKIITEQQKIVEEMHDGTRVFRHNYRNTIIAIKGYCDNGDYEHLAERINELYNEMDDIYSGGQLGTAISISDAGLRNMIMLKLLEAKRRGISTELKISGEHFPEFENMTMLNAIGALLDNAIEAAESSKEKCAAIELFEHEGRQRLLIANSFSERPDLSRIMSKDYSTKNQSGLGLYYVSRVVSKRKNAEIAFNCGETLFCVCLDAAEKAESE